MLGSMLQNSRVVRPTQPRTLRSSSLLTTNKQQTSDQHHLSAQLAKMVRPGFKTKILTLSLACIAEYLKNSGRTEYGAEFVFGVVRPAVDDILSLMTDEDYHDLMLLARSVSRKIKTQAVSLWGRFRQWSG